jgi:hypothetical protein
MYTIKNVRRGKAGRSKFVYADLYNAEGELSISAGLDYIINAIKDNKYKVELDGETLERIVYVITTDDERK